MKHNIKITSLLLIIFLLTQFIGIGIIYNYIDTEQSAVEGETIFKELPIGERPPIEEETSYLPIIFAIFIGTGFLFLLMKFKLFIVWKIWYLLAIVMALTVAGGAFIRTEIALGLALILGLWRIFKPNIIIQNFTELFIYGGLAAIFAPLFNLLSVIILLVLISVYDAYAVWKSKHMIKLAKSQTKAKVFAGLMLPYKISNKEAIAEDKEDKKSKKEEAKLVKKIKTKELNKISKTKKVVNNVRTAILGGGDIGFALIFTGVVLKELGLWQSLIIPFFSAAGLAFLFWKGEQKKFYPAMPFISFGCFLGLGVVWIISYFIL